MVYALLVSLGEGMYEIAKEVEEFVRVEDSEDGTKRIQDATWPQKKLLVFFRGETSRAGFE